MPDTAPEPDLAPELDLAIRVARDAGALLRARFGRAHEVAHKGPRDIVTEADRLSEALILGAIRERFPDDAILAEESGRHRGRRGLGPDPTAGSGRAWVVDPLDGTVNYANGLPLFGVSIALAVDGQPSLGVVYDPIGDELFSALAGRGAQLDGRPVRMPVKERLGDCLVMVALPFRGWGRRERAIRRATMVSRNLGSSTLSLAFVGDGRFDAFIQARGLSAWDVAAAGLIAAEAGATVTDMSGGPWLDLARPSGTLAILAAAPPHHAELLRLLAA